MSNQWANFKPGSSAGTTAPSKPLDLKSCLTTTKKEKILYSSWCLVGNSKSGRTTFASTFPGHDTGELLWIDADKGLSTPAVRKQDNPVFTLEYGRYNNPSDLAKTSEVMGTIFDILMYGDYKQLGLEKYPKTIVVDSGTALSRFMEKEILIWPVNGKDRNGSMQLQDYKDVQGRLYDIIAAFLQLKCHIVFIFNPALITDENLNGKYIAPAVTGTSFCPQIPHLFNEVYLHEYNSDSKKYEIKTKPNGRFPYAGTKAGLPEVVANPTYNDLAKYYNG